MNNKLNNVLEHVSERNNEYRIELRTLKNEIDEKATSIIGDVVTLSNYTLDFSSAISSVKENLVEPISKEIESYALKDLRNVESVNEQFIEKINDKIEATPINSTDEKEKFIENLNGLLNDKYLQIVKIKRTDFLDGNGKNTEVERIIEDFINELRARGSYDENGLLSIFNTFKDNVYFMIKTTIDKINTLYLNNFVSEISSALSSINLYDDSSNEESTNVQSAPSFEIPELNEIPEVPNIPLTQDIPEVPLVDETNTLNSVDINPMDIEPIAPIEVKEEKSLVSEKPKHSYDVEEILKIAKSPVVSISQDNLNKKEDTVDKRSSLSSIEAEFNEHEVVEEMIRRLSNRLKDIDNRQANLDEAKVKNESDEKFVNDLIKNAEAKNEELNEFEKSLDEKEKELDEKQKELEEKIRNVMPFANAVLNTEEGSNK